MTYLDIPFYFRKLTNGFWRKVEEPKTKQSTNFTFTRPQVDLMHYSTKSDSEITNT
jgi:hypothetical protein